MRFSNLLTQTRREAPAELESPGQQWLARAGYIQVNGSALGGLLPLGQRAVRRMEARLARELESLGGVEIGLPPDAHGLAAVFDVARAHLRSYRQLPALLYRFGWQTGPAPRHGGGLLGARVSRVLEVFSLDGDPVHLGTRGAEVSAALLGLLGELGIPLQGGAHLPGAHDEAGQAWLYGLPGGDERLLQCEQCGYSASPETARFLREQAGHAAPAPLEKVATPGCKTIADLAAFLGIGEERTAKAVFLTLDDSKLVFAVVRGDRDVNEAALRRLLGSERLRPASEDEIRAVGAAPGYASPVGLKDVLVIVDAEIPESANLAAGANEDGYHLLNVNYGRDYTARHVAEIALARGGMACPECGSALCELQGVMLAGARRLRADFCAAQGAQFLDENGKSRAAQVEVYQLDLSRALGCLAEARRDAHGLMLPPAAAPFAVHLAALDVKKPAVAEAAQAVEALLREAGLEPLVDDRPDSPGVKFNDADLIGLPVRVTVSERALSQGGVEIKLRHADIRHIVRLEDLLEAIGRVFP